MRAALAAVLGTVTVIGAFAALLLAPGTPSDSALVIAMAALVGVVGVIGALVKLAGSERDDAASAPWDESGVLVQRAPERSPADYDLSGERLAAIVADAGETAREEGTVADGVDAVRPHLREALLAVFVQGGTDRRTATEALARGTWTDDATAAAVLDEAVGHPGWSFLERFEAWLFPEQVVRREVRRAMRAVATVADRELPTVPGQHAPRTVPVVQLTLEDLRRGADGHLQRAADPLGARSGSRVDAASVVDDVTAVEDGAVPDDGSDDDATADDRTDEASADGEWVSGSDALGDVRIGGRPAGDPDDGTDEADDGTEEGEVSRR